MGDPHDPIGGRLAADADMIAYLRRRLANAETMAVRWPENAELARDRARQIEVMIDEISHELHRDEAFVAALIEGA